MAGAYTLGHGIPAREMKIQVHREKFIWSLNQNASMLRDTY